MIERAYAVAMMHPEPRELLMVGLSGGAWAQVLVHLPGVQHLTVVEINPGYLRLMAGHPAVASLLNDPRVEIVVDDGRRWLARHPERGFDVIVANHSFHWRAHMTNLLSVEFLHMVRAHLNPGGLYFFNTTDSPDAYVTAFTGFPHGLRVANFAAVSDSAIGLDAELWRSALLSVRIEGAPPLDTAQAVDRARLAQLLALPNSVAKPPQRTSWETRESVLRRLQGKGRVITDDNMRSEWGQAPFRP
jgi:spermidine synthase